MASKARLNKLTPTLISLAVASCFAAGPAAANPTGPTVVNGQVTINQAGNLLSVTNSPNSIINWQAFSIGANEITRFTQQSASSAVLNRVVGAGGTIDPSVILGALQSNGRVFLLNPAGIVFGAGSQIDVAGLVASSLNLSNADFLGGRLKFTDMPGAGSVVNQGSINAATGGQVYLVGPAVTNNGIITSPKGEVILAAGKSVELVNPGSPNLRVEITAPDNEAKNLGSIVAEAGRVGIYAGLVSHSGTIRADSAVSTEDGRIVLKATKNVDLAAGSVLSASGPAGGTISVQSGDTTLAAGSISATGSAGKGGQVEVLGNLVGVLDGANIDVSGETGGGKALIGGDFQGKNPHVQNAFRTYFGPNAAISANAVGNGDGGTVIVWSDDLTAAYGSIAARGGRDSGNGGMVETSSRGWLDFHASVDTSAPKGRTGTLLLDPISVCIYTVSPGVCGSGGVGSFTSGGAASVFTSSGSGQSLLQWGGPSGGGGSIYSNLQLNNVIVTTSNGDPDPANSAGNISILESSPDLVTSHNLQFVAHNSILVNGSITNSGSGEIRFIAGWNENGTSVANLPATAFESVAIGAPGANRDITLNGSIFAGGGVLMRAANDITLNATINTPRNVFVQAGNNIDANGFISAGDGSVPGIDWNLTLDAGNRLRIFNNLSVQAGPAGTARMSLSAGGGGITVMGAEGLSVGGAGGGCCLGQPGGSAILTMASNGPILIQDVGTIDVIGGEGGFNTSGAGGAGGAATMSLNSNVVGGSITVNNSTLRVTGGAGGGGDDGGGGGKAMGSLTATNIAMSNSAFVVSGGSNASGDIGPGGVGGNATAGLSAGGSVNVQGSSIRATGGVGAAGTAGPEGASGGIASVIVGGDGGITIGSGSLLMATGGAGAVNGGAANAFMASGAGPIAISGVAGIGALGGSGSAARGGDAVTTIAAKGAATIENTSLSNGQGIFATGGRGGTQGGNSTTTIDAQSINQNLSHVAATGGAGGDLSGSAVLLMTATGGDINVTGTGPQIGAPPEASFPPSPPIIDGTVIAQGGFGERVGSTAGGAQVRLAATGKIRITNEGVAAIGGAGETRGGDASMTLLAGTGVIITDSHVVAEGGFSDIQGGKAELFLVTGNGNIEVRGTPGLAATVIARGGRVFFEDGTPGAAALNFGVGGQGEIIIDQDSAQVFGGGIGFPDETAGTLGSNADIFVTFQNRLSGGITVNGNPAVHGFFKNGQVTNPRTAYLGVPPPPPPEVVVPPPAEEEPPPPPPDIVRYINEAQKLAPQPDPAAAPTKEEREQRKKDRQC